MFLGSHNKVMRVIFVVHDILQVDSSLLVQFFEELLIKDKGDPADLFYACLCLGPFVYKVRRDRDG